MGRGCLEAPGGTGTAKLWKEGKMEVLSLGGRRRRQGRE